MSIFISFITEANYRQTFYAIRGNRNETRNIFFRKKNKNTKSSIFTTRLLPAFFLPPNLIHFIHDRHFRLLFTRKRSIQLFLSGRKTRWIDISDAKNNDNDSSFVAIIQGLKFPKDRFTVRNVRRGDEKRADVGALIRRRKKGGGEGGEEISRAKVFNKGAFKGWGKKMVATF